MDVLDQVAIVGMGVVSPYGLGVNKLCSGIRNGDSSYKRETGYGGYIVAKCEQSLDTYINYRSKERTSKMALIAIEEALGYIGGEIDVATDMLGVYTGCSCGGLDSQSEGYQRFSQGRSLSPLTVVKSMSNAPLAEICLKVGAKGASVNYSLACSSSSMAIHEARKALLSGELDIAIAGGVESPVCEPSLAAWAAMRVMNVDTDQSTYGCRPFDENRKGLVLGEGAAFFIMERLSTAIAKERDILAILSGSGVSTDSKHMTNPCSEGQELAIRKAIKSANLLSGDIGLYNAHGTGTEVGDLAEAATIKKVWGEDISNQPYVSATKSLTGHLLGGAGALELAITVDCIKEGYVPSYNKLNNIDSQCEINIRKEKIVNIDFSHGISSTFAFGGHNVVLVLSKYDV